MSHSSSIVSELFVGLYNGSEIVFTTKLLRVVTILKLMQEYEITIFFAVPTILKELMVSHKKSEFNLSKLRIINFYGASMNSDDIVRLIASFPWANIIYIKYIKVLDKLYKVTDISLSDMNISASECENPAPVAEKDVFLL